MFPSSDDNNDMKKKKKNTKRYGGSGGAGAGLLIILLRNLLVLLVLFTLTVGFIGLVDYSYHLATSTVELDHIIAHPAIQQQQQQQQQQKKAPPTTADTHLNTRNQLQPQYHQHVYMDDLPEDDGQPISIQGLRKKYSKYWKGGGRSHNSNSNKKHRHRSDREYYRKVRIRGRHQRTPETRTDAELVHVLVAYQLKRQRQRRGSRREEDDEDEEERRRPDHHHHNPQQQQVQPKDKRVEVVHNNNHKQQQQHLQKPQVLILTLFGNYGLLGSIRIILRPDLSKESVDYIKEVVESYTTTTSNDNSKVCDRCSIYHVDKTGHLIQGTIMGKIPPAIKTRVKKGPCPTDLLRENEDNNNNCHGPIMTKGMLAWSDGHTGPDFIIHAGDRPANWWGTKHTVWGQIPDKASFEVIDKLYSLPAKERKKKKNSQGQEEENAITYLEQPIRFNMKIE